MLSPARRKLSRKRTAGAPSLHVQHRVDDDVLTKMFAIFAAVAAAILERKSLRFFERSEDVGPLTVLNDVRVAAMCQGERRWQHAAMIEWTHAVRIKVR